MIDPYKMVVVNLLALSLLSSGMLIYKFIYPKKQINLFVLLILISLLPLISILRKGSYESGDLSLHAKIAMDFFNNLSEGNLIPRISSIFCAKHGCPDFIFMYPFPYYLVSFFHLIGFSFIGSIKLLLASTFISSGIFMYLWIKDELGTKSALVSAIFYLFAPYHLINMHFRVDIAEMLSFTALPLCFLSARKTIYTGKFLWFFINSISSALLIGSHQSIALFSFPFIISYATISFLLIKGRKINNLTYYLFSVALGILLLSFYWIPVLFEAKYIYWSKMVYTYFPDFLTFIYAPWRYGFLFQGPDGHLGTIVGYIHLFIVIISTLIILKPKLTSNLIYISFRFINKFFGSSGKISSFNTKIKFKSRNKKFLVFFLLSFYVIFFMMQSVSEPFWRVIPLIKNIQFTSRLLILTSFFSSIVAAIIAQEIKYRNLIIAICFLAIFTTILNWGNRGTFPTIDDNYLKDELVNKGGYGGVDFTTPIWVSNKADWINQPSKYPIERVTGEAEITQIHRTTTKHEYVIQVKKDSVLRENTFYFPGWVLKINNKDYPIDYKNPKYSGLMLFNLNKGIYKVEFIFLDTPIRSISKMVSILTFLSLLFYLVIFKFPRFFFQRFK